MARGHDVVALASAQAVFPAGFVPFGPPHCNTVLVMLHVRVRFARQFLHCRVRPNLFSVSPSARRSCRWTIFGALLLIGELGCLRETVGQQAQFRAYRVATSARSPAESSRRLKSAEPPLLWSTEELVQQILLQNPSVDAAQYAWRAAIGQIGPARIIADPKLSFALAPLSLVDPDADLGQTWRVEQNFPLASVLDARSQVATARARQNEALFYRVQTELARQARYLWIERWEISQSLALLEHHQARFAELKQSVSAALESGRASLQDPLRMERNLVETERERGQLGRRQQIIEARINGLLHRPPDAQLPTPSLAPEPLAEAPLLERAKVATGHPQLMWQAAHEDEALAEEQLARARLLPELAWSAQYSTMFMQPSHQWMIGAGIQIPLGWAEKQQALEAALATRERRRFESLRAQDEIAVQVHSARVSSQEASSRWHLYEQRLIPTAEAEVAAARVGFETGQTSFQQWVTAENDLQTMQLARARARADLHRAYADALYAAGQATRAPDAAVPDMTSTADAARAEEATP